MSSWSYCKACDAGLDRCTLAEAYRGVKVCPHCDATNDAILTFDEALEYHEEYVKSLEERIKKIESTFFGG